MNRVSVVWGGISLALAILLWGLWSIQINKGEDYYILSEENRIKHIPLEAPRGTIYDRNGEVLVDNRPSFHVLYVPEELRKRPQAIALLAELMGVREDWIWEKIRASKGPSFVPIKLFHDISLSDVARLEEHSLQLPGLYINVQPKRKYVHGDFASHLLGYVGEIGPKDLKKLRVYGYRMGDILGKDGIERTYDRYLQGEKGGKQIEVTAAGRPKRELGYKEPVKGHDVVLTIDANMQKACERAMEGHKGAVILMQAQTGEILAMKSNPSFDPNIFVDGQRLDELRAVLKDGKNRPLMNRTITAQYPPGSIFKVIMGLLGLQENVVDSNFSVNCSGSYRLGRVFHCWFEQGHGPVDLSDALRASCNIYFYRMGVKLGIDKIAHYCKVFGFGKKTGVELLNEKPGFIPSKTWKQRRFKEPWYKGETVNMSIGQGYLLVTPIQLLTAINAVVNGGHIYRPQLVKQIIRRGETGVQSALTNTPLSTISMLPKHVKVTKEGMRQAVNDPRGTGQRAFLDEVVVSGKTGTVQVVGREAKEKIEGELPEHFQNHAWFAGFAPYDEPTLSIIVFLEHGRSGGRFAAEVAHDILKMVYSERT